MRTALGLTLVVTGIIAVASAFARNPDPRVMIGQLFRVNTSALTLINDPGPSFGMTAGALSGSLSPENLDRVISRRPGSASGGGRALVK